MLSLFSGPSHEGDVHGWLQRLATERGFQLSMAEFDAARDPPTDLSVPGFWDPLFSEIKAGSWDILLLSPPGSTFSRARNRHDGRNGPRPVRDHTFPWGFPWLRNADRDRVSEANWLTSSSSNAYKLQNFKIRQASVGCSCIRRISGLPLRASVRRAFGSCPA